eukprot:15299166-Alexandrium_andersonii.AAC.1
MASSECTNQHQAFPELPENGLSVGFRALSETFGHLRALPGTFGHFRAAPGGARKCSATA